MAKFKHSNMVSLVEISKGDAFLSVFRGRGTALFPTLNVGGRNQKRYLVIGAPFANRLKHEWTILYRSLWWRIHAIHKNLCQLTCIIPINSDYVTRVLELTYWHQSENSVFFTRTTPHWMTRRFDDCDLTLDLYRFEFFLIRT